MNTPNAPQPTPPAAARKPVRIEQLGRVRTDDYAWLRDANWQAVLRDPAALDPEIRAHLVAENAYTDAVLAGTKDLQATLLAEMKGRIKDDDSTVPAPHGPYAYYRRFDPGAEHPVIARTPRAGGAEQVLLDLPARAKGHAFFSAPAVAHSDDHRLLAWAEDTQGSEVYRIHVREIETGAEPAPPIESCSGDFTFSPCARFIFWVFRDDHGRPTKVFRRALADGGDTLVYAEPDPGFFLGVETSLSGGSILVSAGNQDTSEVWRIPGDDPTAPPALIAPREPGLRYDVDDAGDRLIIRTNADGAVDFKLVEAPLDAPGHAHWRDLVPHRPGRYLVGAFALKHHIVRLERIEANTRIIVAPRDGGAEWEIAQDEPAYVLRAESGLEYDTATIRYVYSSPTTPRQTFDYDLATRTAILRKTQDIPSGHDPARYETRRIDAPAGDGASIPVTVLMRRGQALDGAAPLLLYGYGAYGIPMEPWFRTSILSLVDRGWIFAIAHVRGGTEKGWNWFLGGRAAHKMNSFTDFIAAAEALIGGGYARAGNIVAQGGSAGGLLVGAAFTMRPDLWAGVIAEVPFVDVLNTISDDTLPLTPPEWPEWGNPITDPAAYDTIAAYSPYDNLAPRAYPPILCTGGLSDPRVTYWEPAKFVARLRALATGPAPALLRIDMEAGHAGAAGRFDALKQTALTYAFALWSVGAA
ncbi:S9 family peptidase [Acidiphilium sp.]|uniref:S9 family peptidase n=1 Tax=Acidiphilium sp. TaxID=527 RepID=UPI00258D94A5|nr:S9 family peptidase [Acidiphilium sp.]